MKKLYSYLGLFALIFTFNSLQAQIIVVQDFEDPTALNISDFPGWSTLLPPFNPGSTDPCEGTQSLSRNLSNVGSSTTVLQYVTPTTSGMVSSGSNIEVSFEFKIIDETTGNPLAASVNFGTVELSYSTDGGATWTVYDTIDQNDLPTGECSTKVDSFPFPANTTFAWQLNPDWADGDWTIYVDDFKAIEQVPCIQPINIEVSDISYTSAKVTWEDPNNPAIGNYEVAFCGGAGNPDTNATCTALFGGGIQSVTNGDTHLDLTGLNEGQPYYVYVRAVCGTGSNSIWTGPILFQTVAVGSECSNPIVVSSALPYTDISFTSRYSTDNYVGGPGGNCGGSTFLDGYEVIYQYTPPADDILTIDVTGITANHVGVFVYEDCGDIGNICMDGTITELGTNLNLNSLFVTGGQDYYIVIASTNGNGEPMNTDYTLTIEGFNCATWIPPVLPPSGSPIYFVAGQPLSDFNDVGADFGVEPTIKGATLTWYTDNNGSIGSPITTPLSNVMIQDQDCFWVTQNVNTCESPAIQVCFDEFNCNTDLGGITATTADSVCDTGTVNMTATANTSNIYWYDSQTGGELVAIGNQFTSPTITQNTSYWVTEVFLGAGTLEHQGNPGPTTQSVSSNDNYGLTLDIQQRFTIMDVTIYVAGGGNVELELTTDSGDIVHGPQVFAVNSGSSTSPAANVLNLDWTIDPQDWNTNTYYLRKKSGPALLMDSNPNFPYLLGSGNSITGGANTSGSITSGYYYFFDWTVTGPKVHCEVSPRTQVIAVVHETKPTQLSADEYIVCVGASTNLHATSVDQDYVYTWNGSDGTGPLTGSTVNVTLTQNTTYTVNAVNPNTGCSYENTISLEVKGAADLGVSPDTEMCVNETIKLTAGGVVYNFEENPNGWTTTNNSTSMGQNISLADWKVVNSPYGSLGISSSDNSSFYISQVNLLGPDATSDTRLISPPISMVGVGSASVTFEHFLRHSTVHSANGYLEVSVDNGPWQPLKSYTTDIGGSDFDPFENFVSETVDLSPYVGSTIQISFNLRGEWGWYWAIDNVVITRNFLAGSVSWSPLTDLYFDSAGNIPYTGTSTNEVYFTPTQGGTYTYTANLSIVNCSTATEDVVVTVYETDPPTTNSQTQSFLYGETLGSLDVTGQNLKYYVMDNNGNLDRISVNTPLVDGMTYYITQTLNGCEGDAITVTVTQICTEPSNLNIIVAPDGNNASQITATWDPPADLAGVQGYRIVITDMSDPNQPVVYDDDVPLTRTFDIIDDLPCASGSGTEYQVELFSICDELNGVYGSAGTATFYAICLGTTDFQFADLSYYPNPTPGIVYFDNTLPIEKIEVFDLNGKKIFEKKADATSVPVNFKSLASGTYLVAISVNGNKKVIQIIRE